MLRLIADENVSEHITDGLHRHAPTLDLLRVEEVGLAQTDDRIILEWAAANGRVIITCDVISMVGFACDRINKGLPMPGLPCLPDGVTVAEAIAEIHVAASCSSSEDLNNQILFIPI